MSLSMRNILLEELGVEETEKLAAISKLVRAHSKMDKFEKRCCSICNAPSKCISNSKEATNIYNHHVMKVEYIAILVDKFGLYKASAKQSKKGNKAKDYSYIDGFEPYCPRVAVCHDNHTMFHELVGDNPLNLVKDVELEEAENIVDVFERLHVDVLENCKVEKNDKLKDYKDTYLKIWNETMLKSLTRLGYVVKLNELRTSSKKEGLEDIDETLQRYDELERRIDEIIELTLQLDEESPVKLPELDAFSFEELEDLEYEFANVGKVNETQNVDIMDVINLCEDLGTYEENEA